MSVARRERTPASFFLPACQLRSRCGSSRPGGICLEYRFGNAATHSPATNLRVSLRATAAPATSPCLGAAAVPPGSDLSAVSCSSSSSPSLLPEPSSSPATAAEPAPAEPAAAKATAAESTLKAHSLSHGPYVVGPYVNHPASTRSRRKAGIWLGAIGFAVLNTVSPPATPASRWRSRSSKRSRLRLAATTGQPICMRSPRQGLRSY